MKYKSILYIIALSIGLHSATITHTITISPTVKKGLAYTLITAGAAGFIYGLTHYQTINHKTLLAIFVYGLLASGHIMLSTIQKQSKNNHLT
jgi:hypothetical protein